MKIANFSYPCVLNAPAEGVSFELGTTQGSKETRMMVLPETRKSFKIDVAVLIHYRRVTDRHPATSHIPRLLRRAGKN